MILDADHMAPTVLRLNQKINLFIEDAESHAKNAITYAVQRASDGRSTIAKIRQTRYFDAANHRLDLLGENLRYEVGKFRSKSYRDAFKLWADAVPIDSRRPGNIEPSIERTRQASTLVIHGQTVRSEIGNAIDGIKKKLLPVLTQAGRRGLDMKSADSLIASWAKTSVDTIRSMMVSLVSDSQVICDRMAGRDVCRPELLEPDPMLS